METGTFSSVLTDWAMATGASLTGVMVMETVAVLEVAFPSLMVNLKESAPLAFVAGV